MGDTTVFMPKNKMKTLAFCSYLRVNCIAADTERERMMDKHCVNKYKTCPIYLFKEKTKNDREYTKNN